MHPVASRTLASWRLFRRPGCSASTPLHALHPALPICTHSSSIAYLTPFEIYRAQALPRRRVGHVSTSTQDRNSILQRSHSTKLIHSVEDRAASQHTRIQRGPPHLSEVRINNIQTPMSDDGGTSLGSGNFRASLRGLREALNLREAKKRAIRAGFQMHAAPATRLPSTLSDGERYWLPHPGEAIGKWEA